MERAEAVEPVGLGRRSAAAESMSGCDDAELVSAIARGESAALDEVYDRYSRAVYSLAVKMLGDHATAEDVTQDTFVKVWRQPQAYRPERGKLQPWLLGIAHHRAIDLLRRARLEQARRAGADLYRQDDEAVAQQVAEDAPEADPQRTLGANEDQRAVYEALAELPREQRVALELAYYRGYTQAEIAQRLNAPLGTIKTRMRLALLRLRAAPSLLDVWKER